MKHKAKFFRQTDEYACGLAVINVILSVYNKEPIVFEPNNGVTPKKMTSELNSSGLYTEIKDREYDELKEYSIVYYPSFDHYVVTGERTQNRIYVYDSLKNRPGWIKRKTFENKWLANNGLGWSVHIYKK